MIRILFAFLFTAPSLLAQQGLGDKTSPLSDLDSTAFQQEFESAHAADDWEQMEALVAANPTRFVELFENYVRVWAAVVGEKLPEHPHAHPYAWAPFVCWGR